MSAIMRCSAMKTWAIGTSLSMHNNTQVLRVNFGSSYPPRCKLGKLGTWEKRVIAVALPTVPHICFGGFHLSIPMPSYYRITT